MHYVVCAGEAGLLAHAGVRVLADGDMLVLEGPWTLGRAVLGVVEDEDMLARLRPALHASPGAFAVEGMAAPEDGAAFVIAAHTMLDPVAFRPYADAIPDMLADFGVRSLARGGKVTPLAGDFVPDRGVVLEFQSAAAVIDFYTSEAYAPLLALRLRTTDPRFVVLTRAGPIQPDVRARAQAFLRQS